MKNFKEFITEEEKIPPIKLKNLNDEDIGALSYAINANGQAGPVISWKNIKFVTQQHALDVLNNILNSKGAFAGSKLAPTGKKVFSAILKKLGK